MRYMLFVCFEQTPIPTDDVSRTTESWSDEMDRRGIRLLGNVLGDPSEGRTLRVRDGKTVVTDGPFVKTTEFIAGFDVIECTDLDEAMKIAAAHPMAGVGMIEVRPFWTD